VLYTTSQRLSLWLGHWEVIGSCDGPQDTIAPCQPLTICTRSSLQAFPDALFRFYPTLPHGSSTVVIALGVHHLRRRYVHFKAGLDPDTEIALQNAQLVGTTPCFLVTPPLIDLHTLTLVRLHKPPSQPPLVQRPVSAKSLLVHLPNCQDLILDRLVQGHGIHSLVAVRRDKSHLLVPPIESSPEFTTGGQNHACSWTQTHKSSAFGRMETRKRSRILHLHLSHCSGVLDQADPRRPE
jgi:hypothetical protein